MRETSMPTELSSANENTPQGMAASKSLFIRRWGELSGYWGINRTMAEIHALLFVSTEPICTDDVMEKLLISRGNSSMNLRSLVDWGLIERVHLRGDRKEYFTCRTDVWQMFETILQQRRRREVEPIIETIERCVEMAASHDPSSNGSAHRRASTGETEDREEIRIYRERLKEMHTFLKLFGSLVDLVVKLGPKELSGLAKTMAAMTP